MDDLSINYCCKERLKKRLSLFSLGVDKAVERPDSVYKIILFPNSDKTISLSRGHRFKVRGRRVGFDEELF